MTSSLGPLTGHTVLVTRSASQSPQFTRLLTEQGAAVLEMPTLEIGPPSSWAALDRAIDQVETFDWLVLTSANGVEAWFGRLAALGVSLERCQRLKIAVVGKKTAQILEQQGRSPDFIPPDYVADSLVSHFPEAVAGRSILFPRVETGGRELLAQALRNQGATVTEVPAYESRCPARLDAIAAGAIAQHQVTVVTFASSKTVQNFSALLRQQFGEGWLGLLERTAIASIGPQTSATCEAVFDRVDIEAQEYTLEGLTEAICTWAKAGMGKS